MTFGSAPDHRPVGRPANGHLTENLAHRLFGFGPHCYSPELVVILRGLHAGRAEQTVVRLAQTDS